MGTFEFDGHDDESFIRGVAEGQTNRHPYTGEAIGLRTSLSDETEPRAGLTTYGVSELMQGMGSYTPTGIAYDAFNQTVSGDLGHFMDSEGGIGGTLGSRAPLLASDIYRGRRGFDDGRFTQLSGISGLSMGEVTGLNTTPTPRPTISGNIEEGSFPSDYGLENGAIPEEFLVRLGIPENDTTVGAITEHMLWEPAALTFLDMMDAMEADTGGSLNRTMIDETYRTIEKQEYFYMCMQTGSCNNGNTAAAPGTSNHGWGVAIDFGAASAWILANGPDFNWHHGDAPNESWHFTYNRYGI